MVISSVQKRLTIHPFIHFYSFSLSLIDSLDTLIIMGNITEFQKAYHLVISQPSFDIDVNTSVFEANIRGDMYLLLL